MNWKKKNDEELPWLLQMSIFGNEEVYIGEYESIKDAEDELKDLSKNLNKIVG